MHRLWRRTILILLLVTVVAPSMALVSFADRASAATNATAGGRLPFWNEVIGSGELVTMTPDGSALLVLAPADRDVNPYRCAPLPELLLWRVALDGSSREPASDIGISGYGLVHFAIEGETVTWIEDCEHQAHLVRATIAADGVITDVEEPQRSVDIDDLFDGPGRPGLPAATGRNLPDGVEHMQVVYNEWLHHWEASLDGGGYLPLDAQTSEISNAIYDAGTETIYANAVDDCQQVAVVVSWSIGDSSYGLSPNEDFPICQTQREYRIHNLLHARTDLQWPQLSGHSQTNRTITEFVYGLRDEWLAGIDPELRKQERFSDLPDSGFELGYGISLLAPDVVSIRFEIFEMTWPGIYPKVLVRYLVIDTQTGEIIEPDEIVSSENLPALFTAFLDDLEAQDPEGPFSDMSLQRDAEADWYRWDAIGLRPEGLVIGMDRGELLPAAWSFTVDAVLPWSDIEHLVNANLIDRASAGVARSASPEYEVFGG